SIRSIIQPHLAFTLRTSPFYSSLLYVFFFKDPATTEIYTLSLHDALPIYVVTAPLHGFDGANDYWLRASSKPWLRGIAANSRLRSEEHTSELQSRENLVCRLLLEKKKKIMYVNIEEQITYQNLHSA